MVCQVQVRACTINLLGRPTSQSNVAILDAFGNDFAGFLVLALVLVLRFSLTDHLEHHECWCPGSAQTVLPMGIAHVGTPLPRVSQSNCEQSASQ